MVTRALAARLMTIRLVLTDNDGVLTDGGVWYSARGEELKRYSLRDGMGVARLRSECGIETGIMTGEHSPSLVRRAEKLGISEVHLGCGDKAVVLDGILARRGLGDHQVAYIGDDVNDLAVLRRVGFAATPADGMAAVRGIVHHVCAARGGDGAFREFAEIIIAGRQRPLPEETDHEHQSPGRRPAYRPR
jgi:3-deoxy-D-manno-octulosonate 8-phosphate phosphatase (KDO 8-P phosphatase)